MEMLEEHRCFEGWQQRWRHDSSTLNCPMTFSIFLPPPRDHTPPPVLYWLADVLELVPPVRFTASLSLS